ncbi:MAG: rhomboid family intramembrane serine protease [Ectothiorhodospiraceae bacterium]|jgi:membrane associated rhomboid family serine protease
MTITLSIIAITVVISLLAWQQPRLLDSLIYWPPAVSRGEWWRLLTHGFIHADGGHLLFNMITLYFFGSVMERVLTPYIGVPGFVLFYLAGIVVAILPTHLRQRGNTGYRSLGASGAVSAMLFAFILLRPWSMLVVFVVPVPAIVFAVAYVAYSVWADRNAPGNINHGAHLWGAAWGVGFMVWLEPRVLQHFLSQLMSPSLG